MNKVRKFILLISLIILLLFEGSIGCLPAAAVLRKHHESPGVMRYHVHHSLKDKQGMTWQVILFPEYKSDRKIKYHLRLVGFPGMVKFIHPEPLELITNQGKVLNATDIITDLSFSPNVGEFDLTNILPILPEKGALKLSAALSGDKYLSILIPESALIEWKWLVQKDI